MIDNPPFEGVHFYSAEELAAILSGFAREWSKKTGKFVFDDLRYAQDMAVISAANAKAYESAHGVAKTPHTTGQILAALPPKPATHWLGLVREFQRGLTFNLLGYQPTGPMSVEDIKAMGSEANQATMFVHSVDYMGIIGPKEVP